MASILENINGPKDLKNIPKDKLSELSSEIRAKIIETMSRNGGHLASNLGIVELSVALHYVFDAPKDKIVFDVGHQSYTHKILTGRNANFDTIRTRNGISGFTRISESLYDSVDSGHSSTSISQAAGFAIANKLNGVDSHTIVVIGDGSLTGGVAFEGLYFTGNREIPIIIILNDNDMSIGKNVGAISKHFTRLTVSKFYQNLTDSYIKAVTKRKGIVKFFFWFAKKIESALKLLFGFENIFTNLGFEYIGPIDGHNIGDLITILQKIKDNVKRPVLLHIKTVKGKGFKLAEGNPANFHGVTPFTMSEGVIEPKIDKTFTEIFSEKIVEMGNNHKNIIAVTAAMEDGTGLKLFAAKFPDRFFDVGIAEQHAVSFCSTLGYSGFRPVFAVYSTFLSRAIDQVIQDVCISKSPVIFAIDRAGISGTDGATHQGQFDISLMKTIPNIVVLAPCDAMELKMAFDYAYSLDAPCAIRYPKGTAEKSQLDNYHPDIYKNPSVVVKSGGETLVIVVGPFVSEARKAVENLDAEIGIVYLRVLKPLPEKDLLKTISSYKNVLIIEENVFSGSASEEIAALILQNGLSINFSSINIPDKFIEHDTRDNILSALGFDAAGIKRALQKMNAAKMLHKRAI